MMLLYLGFSLTFVTFPLLIPSHSTDFVHTILPSVVLLILTTLCFIIPPNLSFLRRSISGKKFTAPADQLCRRFTFAEIRAATRNFSHAFVIGKGGFGKVFKGIIDNGATTVAIKRLDPMSKQGVKEFSTEIEMLSKIRHSHVVSLIGYCDNNDEMILVYEYVENGSLADHLYKEKVRNGSNSNMSWVKRVKICIGAARGLDYLHTGTCVLQRVIHRDVKSSNILLDENWAAKISDFGLSKIGPANQSLTHVSTHVKETQGYCDPEYFLTRRLTRKSDVFSFGVVLFEVLCGRPVFDYRLPKDQINLVLWAQHRIQEDKTHLLIDPNLKWEVFENSLKAFVKIAGQCLHSHSKKRPTMSEVVASLEIALALQENKDSALLDEDIFYMGETLEPLSHSPPTGPNKGIEKPSLGEDTLREDALGGSASETLSKIKGNMTCEEEKDYFVLDNRETEGSSTVLSDIAYTDSSSSIVLKPLPPNSPVGQSERIEKTSVAKNTSNKNMLVFFEGINWAFDLAELLGAEAEILGKGTYKVKVDDSTVLVVKRLREHDIIKQKFKQEMEVAGSIRHENVAPLRAYYCSKDEKLMLYDYYDQGSVSEMLHSKRGEGQTPLDWETRLRIAIGTARGIAYIHTQTGGQLVHGNIKASNIFLNYRQHGCISEHGLATLINQSVLPDTKTPGYRAPEVTDMSKVSQASDVYSYGILLLELLTGKSPVYSTGRDENYQYLVRWVNSVIREEWTARVFDIELLIYPNIEEEMAELLQIGMACTQTVAEQRPKMTDVVKMVEDI
ncbi:hypothetical protein LguiB_026751 [Lonicera macranthoides]